MPWLPTRYQCVVIWWWQWLVGNGWMRKQLQISDTNRCLMQSMTNRCQRIICYTSFCFVWPVRWCTLCSVRRVGSNENAHKIGHVLFGDACKFRLCASGCRQIFAQLHIDVRRIRVLHNANPSSLLNTSNIHAFVFCTTTTATTNQTNS